MKTAWIAEQKTLQQQKILEKIERGRLQSLYTHKCLQACKSWAGPVTSVEELNDILKKNSGNVERIVN